MRINQAEAMASIWRATAKRRSENEAEATVKEREYYKEQTKDLFELIRQNKEIEIYFGIKKRAGALSLAKNG